MTDRLARLARKTAAPGWDGPGSNAIPEALWQVATDLMGAASVEVAALPDPFVSPSGDGTVVIRWAWKECSFDAEIDPDGTVYWSRNLSGIDSSGTLNSSARVLEMLRATFGGG